MKATFKAPLVIKSEVTRRFNPLTGDPQVFETHYIQDSAGNHVGILSEIGPDRPKVAALMEAATEMLDALKYARQLIRNESLAEAQPGYLAVIEKLDAVIARASQS